ncbi:beta strand repeat-containing protein [Nostoc sp.]|uniref:beta strand repeat-containing protein n=1 Tax=Nostoc sp. TaxID=1180 RepID=UPI002FFC7C46
MTVNNSLINANSGGGIYDESSLTVNNSTISSNTINGDGGGINVASDDIALVIRIKNSAIINNTALDGGGIYKLGNSNLLVSNSTISANKATSQGGGIYGGGIYGRGGSGSITVNNSLINANSGGGIYDESSLTVNNSTISSNTTDGEGGGINVASDDIALVIRIKNSAIINNTALDGGGISTINDLIVSNSIISGNKATSQGGGIYDHPGGAGVQFGYGSLYATGNITLTNSQINDNSTGAQGYGGGISNVVDLSPQGSNAISATITVSHSTINGNNSYYGGGIYNIGILSVNNSTISGNTGIQGGGIYNYGYFSLGYREPDVLEYGVFNITSGNITDNNASDGGGIYNNGILSVNNSTISHNNATNYGGGIYNSSSNGNSISNGNSSSNGNPYPDIKFGIVTVSNSNIIYNTAGAAGGGIYNDKDTNFGSSVFYGGMDGRLAYILNGLGIITVNHSTISGNQAHLGGGIYNDGILTVGNSIIRLNKAFGIELSSAKFESGKGGGIYNSNFSYTTATLDYSTVASNFDTPEEDSNKFIKLDNLVGKFINKDSVVRV